MYIPVFAIDEVDTMYM